MRILIADDRPKVRFALRVLLEQQPGWQMVGEATDATDLLRQAGVCCADLVLLDWDLPGMVAGKLVACLRQNYPGLMIIALSGKHEARRAALAAGADGFVSKADPPERLLAAIGESSAIWGERCTEVHSEK
jgi:DNA-binding NarL/FixJ family response regulator